MVISIKTYEQVALEDRDEKWELHHGVLRKKPPMTTEHTDIIEDLMWELTAQLNRREISIRINSSRLQHGQGSFYIPDLIVLPRHTVERRRAEFPKRLEVHNVPALLVVEVWSPSTGDFDVMGKLPEYRQRGDAEIWLIHPYERTLTAWRRQPDGSYTETLLREGSIEPVALPGVEIDVASLFRS